MDDSENDAVYMSILDNFDHATEPILIESDEEPNSFKQTLIQDFFTSHPAHVTDLEAYKTWIYPTNMSVRDYQLNIVQRALFTNTLNPDRLGKTLIAAVVMYNYYRWFPEGKIIFMAPTKPLVNQQMDACHNMTGLSRDFSVELTGSTSPDSRKGIWKEKRVFFITPQVLSNDLTMGIFPCQNLVLLVMDEAHRATGNYAYCEIMKSLESKATFRVLALSATPGSDFKALASVVESLKISKIEIRTEESMDIIPYIHQRALDIQVLEWSDAISRLSVLYSGLMSIYLKKLNDQRVYYETNPLNATAYMIMESRKRYLQNNVGPQAKTGALNGMILGSFAIAHTLAYAYQLLNQHGIHSFYTYLDKYKTETLAKGSKASKSSLNLIQNPQFKTIMESITRLKQDPSFSSHPKMKKLVEIVLAHFKEQQDTRVIVFSQFRESVDEITATLNKHQPLIRTTSFIGQSSGSRGKKGFTQKDQLQVILEFQNGHHNVLVATCIGEEGLDIGQVDLIVCFDSQNSPIRMLQRMGRTGRNRKGRVVLLLTKGREEESYKRAQEKYKSVQNAMIKEQGGKIKMYIPQKDVLVKGLPKPSLVKMNLDLPTVEKKVVTFTCRDWRLTVQQRLEWESKFKSLESPALSLSKYIYRQIQPMPNLNLHRSKRCIQFCNLVQTISSLMTTEEQITFSLALPSSPFDTLPHEQASDDILSIHSSTPSLEEEMVADSLIQDESYGNEFSDSILLHALESTPDFRSSLRPTLISSSSPLIITKKRRMILPDESCSLPKKSQETTPLFKIPRPKKKTMTMKFMDLEAELSQGDAHSVSSDTDGSDLDQDLSGFVVGNDTCTQVQGQTQSVGFYRHSLLSPEAGGMGIAHKPGGFQFRQVKNVPVSSEMSHRDFSCSDTPGSLASFVVDDEDDVLYDLSQESLLD